MTRRAFLIAVVMAAVTSKGLEDGASRAQSRDPRDLIVMLTVKSGDQRFYGAGIIVSQAKRRIIIATAKHVIANTGPRPGALEILVEFNSQRGKTYPAKTTRYVDDAIDLAVIIVDDPDAPSVLSDALAASVSTVPPEALQDRQVLLVGQMKKLSWEHSLTPEKVARANATEIVVPSMYVETGASGGGMFEAESGALIGMVRSDEEKKAIALPIQLVIAHLKDWNLEVGLRSDSQSARIEAQHQLLGKGYPLTAAGLAQALVGADQGTLGLFMKTELPASVIVEALRTRKDDRTVAQCYFEAVRASGGGLSWLLDALSRSQDRIDPNLPLPHPQAGMGEEAIINAAARAANTAAVIALLKAGASPHGYQSIRNWSLSDPRFLFPFGPIWKEPKFSAAEKKQLFTAMIEAGAVVMRVPPVATEGGVLYGPIAHDIKYLQEAIQTTTGQPLPATPNLCETIPEPACRRDSKRYGVDWCKVIKTIPKLVGRLVGPAEDGYTPPFIVRYYLGADAHTAYFLAELLDFASGYALLEADADLQHLRLLRYTNMRWVGAGPCMPESDVNFCWTQLALTREPRSGGYTNELDSKPPVPVSWSCAEAAAQTRLRAGSVVPHAFSHPDPRVVACVKDILAIPRAQLDFEAMRFSAGSQAKAATDAKTCVVSDLHHRRLNLDPKARQVTYVETQAQLCCEKTLGAAGRR
jgi:hypothetical protein